MIYNGFHRLMGKNGIKRLIIAVFHSPVGGYGKWIVIDQDEFYYTV